MDGEEWLFEPKNLNAEELAKFGRILDRNPQQLHGQNVVIALAENLLRVRTRSGLTRPLRANEVQRAFEMRRGQRNIVLKARQLGLTTWAAARFFLKTITRPGTLTLQVAHTQESAEEIFRIVHRFLDYLPERLLKGCLKTSRANVRQIVFPVFDSQYRVVSAGERNAGRGMTVQNLHCSELARWPGEPAETLAGLRAALAPDGEEILESTPDGIGGCFYNEWQTADDSGTVRHFFPWWMESCYRTGAVDADSLTEEERDLIERHHLSRAQIGFRRKVQANFHGLARQEFAEDADTCFRASGDSVFELTAIEARLISAPAAVEHRNNGEMEIWLPPLPGKQYLVAVDPAGGGSEGDYSAIEVLDMGSGLQCAEFAGHLGGLELARLATALADEYNQAWLVVELNNHGHGVLSLSESVCHYGRIYRQAGQLGWLTNSVSRPAVIGRLNACLIDQPDRFMSRRLLVECRSFVRQADGSTGARAGTHDDRVMAMAIGLAARAELLEGNNAARF
ncbi:terminase [Telmatobacter sp. DSM 110680]|uniref:Terminase n=1 Tax=Telmatobacter sp. DSM 110680 TaxID=3036704 RepID=A0AAU7DP73_9BACT